MRGTIITTPLYLAKWNIKRGAEAPLSISYHNC